RIYCQIAWGRAKRIVLFITVEKPTYKENLNRVGTFGMPDNIVIEDGRITIVEEAKMWSKRDFERLAEVAKNDPKTFLDKGIPSESDKRQMRYIQLAKHQRSVNYLLQHLDQFPKAKEYEIT